MHFLVNTTIMHPLQVNRIVPLVATSAFAQVKR